MRKILAVFLLLVLVVAASGSSALAVVDSYGCSVYFGTGGHAYWALPLCLFELAMSWDNDWLDDGESGWW